MNIERRLRKKINAIVVMTGNYPDQMRITPEEWEEVQKQLGKIEKFEGVKLVLWNKI